MSQTSRVVVLVRHGETEWTRSKQHTGRTDIPLNDAGRREGELLRHRLAAWPFARVFVSPLSRARDTSVLAGLGDRAEVRPDLGRHPPGATGVEPLARRVPAGGECGAGRHSRGPDSLRDARRGGGRGDLRAWTFPAGARGAVDPRAADVRGTSGTHNGLGERARSRARGRGPLAVERREPSDPGMMLAALIAGSLLAAAPDAPERGAEGNLLAHPAALRASAQPFPPLALRATVVPVPRPQLGVLLLGGAAALAGLALTVPATTHRGCALSGHCTDGTQVLVAGGLFLAGATLLAAADASGPAAAGGAVRWVGTSGAELRERLGLDIRLGAPGPRRALLRWSPFR